MRGMNINIFSPIRTVGTEKEFNCSEFILMFLDDGSCWILAVVWAGNADFKRKS